MINKLAWAYIKNNKKRSLLTLLGIIIATSLITGVFTIFTSMQNTLKEQIIKNTGYYHIKFLDVNYIELQSLKNKFLPDDEYRGVTLQDFINTEPDSTNDIKKYDEKNYSLKAYDKTGFYKLNIKLDNGRYPNNANEIIVSKKMLINNNLNIGDKINYYKKDYIVVGTYSDERYMLYGLGYFISCISSENIDRCDYYMAFNNVTNKKIDEIKKFAEDNSFNVEFNKTLLRTYNISDDIDMDSSLYTFFAILIFIIVIAAISLIYNVFAISVNDRRRELSILACVGADKRQLKKVIYREILMLGSVGVFLGIIFGILGIYITFEVINKLITGIGISDITLNFDIHVNIHTILYSVIISAITLFISGILPARRAKGVSLIEAVKGQENIEISKRIKKKLKRKYYKFKILGGYVGVLAGKNITRSKKRYIVSIISLAISVIIFLASFSFLDISFKMYNNAYGDSNEFGNYAVIYSIDDKYKEDIINYVDNNIEDIDNFILYKRAVIKSDNVENEYISIIGIDRLQNYTYSKEEIKEGILLYDNPDKQLNISSILGTKLSDNKNVQFNINKFDKSGIKEKIYNASDRNKMTVLIDIETFNKYFDGEYNEYSILIGAKESGVNRLGESIHKFVEENDLRENNLIVELKIYKTVKLIIYIFIYGFISLVSLISIVNIINTVSSNINIRIKEIAVLRSVGTSKRSMMLMLFMENIITILKTILLSFPISLIIHILLINSINYFKVNFFINPLPICIVLGMLILFTLIPTIYSTAKLRKSDIVVGIR